MCILPVKLRAIGFIQKESCSITKCSVFIGKTSHVDHRFHGHSGHHRSRLNPNMTPDSKPIRKCIQYVIKEIIINTMAVQNVGIDG